MSEQNQGVRTITHRAFLQASAVLGALPGRGSAAQGRAPGQIRREAQRPGFPSGVQVGDLTGERAMLWSRTDRPARMMVEWATRESFQDARRVVGPAALEVGDFTARLDLGDLPAGQRIFYRVRFDSLEQPGLQSEPLSGSFHSPSMRKETVRFVWGGDVCGQGWGINPELGGMPIWETMRRFEPHFFIHSGDCIYADNPIQAEVKLDDGTFWKNVVTPEKSAVAQTLAEYRGAYAYNLLDANLRRFNSEVPSLVQWDDHEVVNNWFPGRRMDADPRYQEKSVDVLAARARRAFLDYTPIRFEPTDPERVYRSYRYGPSVEVFMLDARSYRGRNTRNDQAEPGPDTPFFGSEQIRWLQRKLKASRATWKVIASDMPLGLRVADGPNAFEAVANGDGPPRGRELELAGLLRFIRDQRIRNLFWVTADVHYAAAHYYDPNRAQFQEFHPFWEFVGGPLNAGTFGAPPLDNTFGPQVKFSSLPPGMKPNRPPSDGLQFFGAVSIDGKTEIATVTLRNLKGETLYSLDLHPER